MAKLPTEVSAEITGLDEAALGIAQVDGRTLRIRNALPGEVVQARILRRRKGRLFADGFAVDHPHLQRQASACPYFPRCGGCSMHHMAYALQLQVKQQQLEHALQAQKVIPLSWSVAQSVSRLGYRRKARLGVRLVGDQVLVGFRESFSNRVARIDACAVLTPKLSGLLPDLKRLLPQLSVADQIPQIEMAQGDENCALIIRHLQPMTDADLQLWSEFSTIHGVDILLQSRGYDSLLPLHGGEIRRLGYRLPDSGLYIQFLPHQFTQVNLAMNQVLIRYVLAYLGDLGGKRVLDLFCGIGNFTLPIARAGACVWGFEAAAEAVQMAGDNAVLNGVSKRVSFATTDLYNPVSDSQLTPILAQADALLLDPPRSGAGPGLAGWLEHFNGDTLVYVSCNPISFAADAAQIVAAGFQLSKVGIFDMFPHTAHVETMGQFVRNHEAVNCG